MNVIKRHPLGSVLVSLWLVGTAHILSSRGLFFDEAIYFVAGKTLAFRGENWNFETWFVGSPFSYPVLVGGILRILQSMGLMDLAIPLVREVNVVIMVATAFLTYQITREIFESRRIAIWATALFGFIGCVIFLGGFATYDAPALLLTTLALWLAIKATRAVGWKRSLAWVVLSGLVFAASFITKYIVLVFLPAMLVVILVCVLGPTRRNRWWRAIVLTGTWMVVVLFGGGLYVLRFWEGLKLVFLYSGGHTATYGATPEAVLAEALWFLGILWILGTIGALVCHPSKSLIAVVLLSASATPAVYHIIYSDPLALFKHMAWGAMLLAPIAGVAMGRLQEKSQSFAVFVMAVAILVGVGQVGILQRFYPDPNPAIEWLQREVEAEDDPILVDDVWAYRWALQDKFDGREWYVVDQWWWQNKLATSDLWIDLINSGTFSYVVFERGGAFNGTFTTFYLQVMETVNRNDKYQLVASFPSYVTWGNSVLPPPFRGTLESYSWVTTEIWKRVEPP